jgi:catechol 2,3-dioxygenase-like lactoylglutathione lyase family enzyme
VDDLNVATAFYRDKLGFKIDFIYEGFYASVSRNGFEIHLKCAPKITDDRAHRKENEHLDASAGVDGVDDLYAEYTARHVTILKELGARPWGTKDFYVEDPDGYIICFGESVG